MFYEQFGAFHLAGLQLIDKLVSAATSNDPVVGILFKSQLTISGCKKLCLVNNFVGFQLCLFGFS